MCTVTYIPIENKGFVLTSNRDEMVVRPTKAPEVYSVNGVDLVFPKDMEKGGTWIASGNNGRLVCLLNGAFVSHQKQHFHTQSRGTVLLAMAAYKGLLNDFFEDEDFSATEPFTIIAIESENKNVTTLLEFIWDGTRKYTSKPDPEKPAIWASATLYSAHDREMRRIWFDTFLQLNKNEMTAEKIYEFHAGTSGSKQADNLLMEPQEGLETVSVTQVLTDDKRVTMRYRDMLNDKTYQIQI